MVDIATTLRMSLRGGQFVLSLLALAFTAGGFYTESGQMVGSHATNFGMFMSYTTLLYSAFQLAAVEHFRAVPPMARMPSLITDAIMVMILFIAGIVLATSDMVTDCEYYGGLLKCGNLKAGTAFTFIAMAAFLAQVVMTQMGLLSANDQHINDIEAGQDYVQEETPKALSPIGAPSPSSKV